MNKTELIDAMVSSSDLSKKDAKTAVEAFMGVVSECLQKGDSLQLIGFGTFKVSERKARMGRNPRTGEQIEIKAAKVPTFVAGKALKDAIQ